MNLCCPCKMEVLRYAEIANGVKMPTIGLGTWQTTDPEEIETAIEAALNCGYRHIDTAFVYQNEHLIGNILKKWFDSGTLKREDVFITTKLPMSGVHPDRVEMHLKKSLTNLQLDYVDLYLIHFPVGSKYREGLSGPLLKENGEWDLEAETNHVAIWKQMEKQVDAGRTRCIGLSNYNILQIKKVLQKCRIKPANVQVEIHVYLQQRELVKFCQDNGISVVAYSPLGSPGINKFLASVGVKERQDVPDILHDKTVERIAEKYSKTSAQILLRFLLQRGISVIPKSTHTERIQLNFDVYNFNLDAIDMDDLFKLEIGERARVCNFLDFPGLSKHPDFPFPIY